MMLAAGPGFVDEDLVEERLAGHLGQRTHGDARLVHIDHEISDALVLQGIGIGSGDEHAHVGDLAAGGPDLLTGDDVLVAVLLGHRVRPARSEPAPGSREQLTPADRTIEDWRQELVDLLLGPWVAMVGAASMRPTRWADPDLSVGHGGHHRSRLRLREALAVGVGTEHRVGVPARAKTVPPPTVRDSSQFSSSHASTSARISSIDMSLIAPMLMIVHRTVKSGRQNLTAAPRRLQRLGRVSSRRCRA